MTENKILSYIGLATKSGNVVSGEFSTEKALKEKKAKLVIIAEDASDNTKKKFTDMCEYRNVKYYFFKDKWTLGHAMGREARAMLALLDKGLAAAIEKQFLIGGNINGKYEN